MREYTGAIPAYETSTDDFQDYVDGLEQLL